MSPGINSKSKFIKGKIIKIMEFNYDISASALDNWTRFLNWKADNHINYEDMVKFSKPDGEVVILSLTEVGNSIWALVSKEALDTEPDTL